MNYRMEHDSCGDVAVPAERAWGAQTQRCLDNFKIGEAKMPKEIIRAFSLLKKCAAEVNEAYGNLDADKGRCIRAACDEILAGKRDEEFPLPVYQTGSGTQTNMNINEVAAYLANAMLEQEGVAKRVHPNDDVNMSQSSNDTFPTAMNVAAVEALHAYLYDPLDGLIDTFRKKSQAYMDLVKIGRTHVQDAVPLTFGQEISAWTEMLLKSRQMIRDGEKYLLSLAIGGTAVGTGVNSPEGFGDKTAKALAKETGFPFKEADNKFYSLTARDDFVFAHGALEALAMDCMKFADDIRLLGSGPRAGMGELTLPANEPGSSIMPGKINPTQCEALTMAACRVHGNQSVMAMGASQGRFQLNVYAPVMAEAFLQSVRILGDAIRSFDLHCAQGMEPVAQRMEALVEKSLMLVTALSPHIGYEKSADIAKKAFAENTSLRDAAVALGYVSAEEYDRYVIPKDMTHTERMKQSDRENSLST